MSSAIHVGVLLGPVQFLDLCGPIDILMGFDRSTLRDTPGLTEATINRGADFTFHYVAPNKDVVETWSTVSVRPTCTFQDCPKLDYLIVGGPTSDYIESMPTEAKNFIRSKADEVKAIFTTCTGAMVLAATGLLDGLEATTQHSRVPQAQGLFPAVKWTAEKNWVINQKGKLWTAAGAMAGMDMMTHWAGIHFGLDLVPVLCSGLDYTPRDVNGAFVQVDL